MIVGYARTSTVEQVAGFEAQDRELRAVGVEKVFAEQVSSVAARWNSFALAMSWSSRRLIGWPAASLTCAPS
jgi:hypothetical protein